MAPFDGADDLESGYGPEDGPQPESSVEGTTEEGPFTYDEEDDNLAFAFAGHRDGAQALREIADFITRNYDSAYEATEEYRERFARDWKLFSGDLPPKSAPFKDCANGHVPIYLENLSRVAFHTYDEIFGDWQSVVQMMPTGPDDQMQSEILTRHQNWQIPQLPGMMREQSRGTLIFFGVGEVACHSYYDDKNQCNRHEILTPEQIVTPYVYVATALDYSDVPWLAKLQMRYRHELEAMRDAYYDVDVVLKNKPPAWTDDPEKRITEALAEARGITLDETPDESAPYQLLWWEGWLKLPNQVGERYCQVILEYRSKHVLQLRIHEHEEWRDVLRYERQAAELDSYRQAKAAYDQQTNQHVTDMETYGAEVTSGALRDVVGPDNEMQAIEALRAASLAPLPPPPKPPAWARNPDDPQEAPEKPRKVPIRLFSHTACIEPLHGALGLGYGRVWGDYNRAANTALSQFTDQATLGNTQTLVTAGDVTFREPFSVGPGKVNQLANFSGDVRSVMVPLTFQPANPQLLELVKEFRMYGQSASQVSEVISGFPGKSGEPFKGLAARLEQATKALSVPARKYAQFFEQIVRNNCLLNSRYLPDEELFSVANDLIPEQVRVTRDMYRRNYDVSVKADMRFTTKAQRISEADEAVAIVNSNPLLAQNAALVYAAYKKAFEARGHKDLVMLMGPPPQPGTMMPPTQGAPPQGAPGAPQNRAPTQTGPNTPAA